MANKKKAWNLYTDQREQSQKEELQVNQMKTAAKSVQKSAASTKTVKVHGIKERQRVQEAKRTF